MNAKHPPHAHSPLLLDKGEKYYSHCRRDVIGAIQERKLTADRVLELGCSAGGTGEALKPLLGAMSYVGVERSKEAAAIARTHLDAVHVADLNTAMPADLGLHDQSFDLLLALDVLEHLYDPWDALARWAMVLAPGGHVAVSLPNVQNLAVLVPLAHGLFPYKKEGLLDATHIRFFTQQSVVELLLGAGLEEVTINSTLNQPIDVATLTPEGNSITHGKLTLNNLTYDDVIRLCTFQYIAIARRAADAVNSPANRAASNASPASPAT